MTLSVSFTMLGSSASAWRNAKVRAQSMVSEMAGIFFDILELRKLVDERHQLLLQGGWNFRYSSPNDALFDFHVGKLECTDADSGIQTTRRAACVVGSQIPAVAPRPP